MSAIQLREAAKVLRARAKAAKPGPRLTNHDREWVVKRALDALAPHVARREREAAARAVRQAAEDLFWNEDSDCPAAGYDVLMDYAERVQS